MKPEVSWDSLATCLVRQALSVLLQAFGWGSPEEAAKRWAAEDAKQKEFNKQRAKVSGHQTCLSSPSLQRAEACGLAACRAAGREQLSALAPCLVTNECDLLFSAAAPALACH